MLMTSQNLVRRLAGKLGLSAEETRSLLESDAEHQFEIELKNGKKYAAFRVQHNNARGPYKGGIRFHDEVSIDEVRALALLMVLKTAAIGLPLGGGKGGVVVDGKALAPSDREEIARAYIRGLVQHIGPEKDIPAPDVNTDAQVIDWMADEYQKITGKDGHATFTGKSLKNNGSEGRDAATGRGGVIVFRELLRLMGQPETELTMAVQGLGNVGSYFVRIAETEQKNWQLIAATDSSGGVISKDGMSAKALDDFKANGGRLQDYDTKSTQSITNQQLVTTEADVLVLAALGNVITNETMQSVGAKYVLELANGPVDEDGYEHLTNKGIIIIPDILANAGGVVVSYLEWKQNKAGDHWSEAKVNQELERYLVQATRTIYTYSQEHSCSLKEAAYSVAIMRILEGRQSSHG